MENIITTSGKAPTRVKESMGYESSEELIEAIVKAKAGDERAVARLYAAFNPALLRFLKARIGSESEDVASEVWLAVARNIKAFEGDDRDFRAWIFATARRRSIDHLRRKAVRPRISSANDANDLSEMSGFESPTDQLEIDEAVAALIHGLNAKEAEIVLLRVVAGLSVEEVAQIVSKSAGSVRVIQHRALKRLANNFRSKQ